MRYTFAIIFIIFIASCNNRKENANSSKNETDTIIPFRGIWANEKYIDTLIKTKSPNKSQGIGYFISIPKYFKDTGNSFVYHEGGGQYTIVKSGAAYFLKYCNSTPDDSEEIIFTKDWGKIKIGNTMYIKVSDSFRIPEGLLFKGEYTFNDKLVHLFEDGKISGLDSVQYYSVENDYIGPGMDNVDLVDMGKTKEKQIQYCFEFQTDTLFIYNIKCMEQEDDGTCNDMQKGALKYKLIKK